MASEQANPVPVQGYVTPAATVAKLSAFAADHPSGTVRDLAVDAIAAIRAAEAAMKERCAVIVDGEHEDPGDGPDAALTRAAAAIRALP